MMQVQILETEFNDYRLRHFVFDHDKILFNTEDLYRILGIKEPVDQPEQDLAGAVLLASAYDADFVDWLLQTFHRYADETIVRPSELGW